VFESHPLTVLTATPDLSCITSLPAGMSFGVRTSGNWSCALNRYANGTPSQSQEVPTNGTGPSRSTEKLEEPKETLPKETLPPVEVPVQVLVDGPYGGCSIDLGDYETVFLLAGGSGITFTLGLLDDIVGRCLKKGRRNGEKTRRIEFAWCIKSFGRIFSVCGK